jgi:hypothetical protein
MGKSQQQKTSPQEIALAEVATAKMADWKKRWAPLMSKLREDVRSAGAIDSFERRQAAGKVATDNAVQFGDATAKLQIGLASSGQGSKIKGAITGVSNDQATSKGLGFVASDQAIDDAWTEGMGRIVSMGQGQSADAVEGFGQLAQRGAAQAAQDAQLTLQRRMGDAQLGAQAVGFGLAGGFDGVGDKIQAKFSQTGLGGSGFGTGLAYGNHDIGGFI